MDDDDMIVVVVGDDDEDEVEFDGESVQMCKPMIKEEPLDENDVMEIMATAAKYGRPIELEIEGDAHQLEDIDVTLETALRNIKKEKQDMTEEDGFEDSEYVYENLDTDSLYDHVSNLKEEIEREYKPSSEDNSDFSESENVRQNVDAKRTKMLSPSLHRSFIEDLRQQYPELRKNQKALIKSLVEIMRNSKAPPLPKDIFVMNDVMFECVKCGSLTKSIPAAGRHYQDKHGPRYLVCFACGVDFRSKTNLYKHEKRCTAADAMLVLQARAQFLGRKARSRPFLPDLRSVPLMKAKNQKRFSCYECSAAFTTKEGLMAHENMHNGIRPHCCDQCPKAYTSVSALSRHLKLHTDEQYICDHCNRSFKIKGALAAHLDTHNPVPKLSCVVCGKRYATKNALHLHVRREHLHLPLPFACHVCPRRYPRMSILCDHMKKKHGMTIMTRKMFFKALPSMTEEELLQAKAILKSDEPPVNISADISGLVRP